ncbi:hypothetical protein FHU33_1067 [Blastococcus colisei]|uniref:Uncharacterized protein n=1 Tax=Blastococcus colisei TaxID=1564162 RepID=A0A543PCE0_9ACTN|nr:hypothetical protein [Blastococcus colisei]TQN41690.1 hypothetical protein FHU33_1067 [Blastococcus colisei]
MRGLSLRRACSDLSDLILSATATTQGLVGFGWAPRPDAPSTYPDLVAAVERSVRTGEPLPVSDENSESVIYAHPDVNLALRYWHDVSHVLRGLDFTPPQELQLAQVHLRVLEIAGYDEETLVWRLLRADLVGQVYLSAVGKRFPADQAAFVQRCLERGLEAAVLAELGGEVTPQRLTLPPSGVVAA